MKAISENINLIVSDDAIKHIKKGHPWVYQNSIIKQNKTGKIGSLAILYDKKRKFIAVGLYDHDSPIRVRVLYRGQKPITVNRDFIKELFLKSFSKRQKLFDDKNTNAFRLVHGENDNFPGLVLDKYNKILVLKLDSIFWVAHLDLICEIITELQSPETIILRLSRTIINSKNCPEKYKESIIIFGNKQIDATSVIFKENGIYFKADLLNGQKTGFFLDQRDNRKKVMNLSKSKKALNLFSYTGGFSLYAAKGEARSVVSVDISKQAIDTCEENFKINLNKSVIKNINHQAICGDVFEVLENLYLSKTKFDLIVVDPPSFAKKQKDVDSAIKAYEKLNKLAVRLLNINGILVSASCSSRVKSDKFFEIVINSVKKSGKNFKILDKTFHAVDHPISFNEGEYLKSIYLKID
jgi:23S rRNA (cytosine1962-C5)-methyltransferase